MFISLQALAWQRLISNFDIERFFNTSVCEYTFGTFVFLLDNRFVAVVWEKAF